MTDSLIVTPPVSSVTIQDWIDDLRTPDIVQTTGRLRGPNNVDGVDGMCCLGRLANLINPDGWGDEGNVQRWRLNPDNPDLDHRYQTHTLGNALPLWMEEKHSNAAAHANDTLGWTFAQIADWAEAGMPLDSAPDGEWFKSPSGVAAMHVPVLPPVVEQ